jgi:2-C-methyl-D-erythritol 4-phosphate cytidylyltransferase
MPATFHVVLITAAPPGQTTEAGGPFTKIDGRESLLRAVELFLNRENVKQIHVVFNNDDMEECKRKYGGHLSLFGVKLIGAPGPRWYDHVAAAAEKVAASDASHVIVTTPPARPSRTATSSA